MEYTYEIYIEPDKSSTIEDIAENLKSFSIIEKTETGLTLAFNDWKLRINLSDDEEITEQASEYARYHYKPTIAKSKVRIDISTDFDNDESHYHDQLYVIESLSELEGAHVYDPELDEFLYGEEYLRVGAPNLRMDFLDVLEEDPEYTEVVERLRENSYAIGLWEWLEEAMENADNTEFQLNCLHNLLTLCPWDHVPWFNSGILYRDMGEYKKAEVYFRKVTEIEPDFSDAWADLGKLCFRKGKTEEGLQYIDNAISTKKDSDLPYINASYYLIKLGDPQKSLEYSEPGIEYDAYCCTFNKAHALLALGKQDEAIEFYRKSLAAARSAQTFKADFKADFVIFKKYDITKAGYEALLPEILN